MKAFTVAAIFGAAALAAPNPDKTVYQTEEVTITSCGPEVTNCPASSAATAVPSAPAYGTPEASVPASSEVEGVTSAPTPESTTSTIYSTIVSSGSEGVVTQTVAISTTICPVTATETPGAPAGTPSAPAAGTPEGAAPPAGTPAYGAPSAPASSGVEGSVPSPSAPAAGSSTNTCEPIISTSTVYITPGVPSAPAGTGYVPYPTGGPYASSPVAGTPG